MNHAIVNASPPPSQPVDDFEYVIDAGAMPGTYVAHLALRYHTAAEFVAALATALAFLHTKYANVVRTGTGGSRNGDRVSVYFWSSGPRVGTTAPSNVSPF